MHPLFGADPRTLARLLLQNGGVSVTHLPAVLAVALAGFGRLPFAFVENRLVARQDALKARMPAPIFIIGHWRSGTTHLYNLLTRSTFGFVTPVAAGLPHEFLTLGRWLRPQLHAMLPKTRYVDHMAVNRDSPQEDEIPLGTLNPISFYHGIYFPSHFDRHFRRSMFLQGCAPNEIKAWQAALQQFIEKLWLDQGKPVLIKNPTYTGRIPLIRELYPEARFIHIYRNPYAVLRSTKRFYRTLLKIFAWQPFNHVNVDQAAIEGYVRLMERVEHDKHALPADRFIDLRFEDLEARPMVELRRIYTELNLGDFKEAKPAIQAYLDTVAGFEKTAFVPNPAEEALVEGRLGHLVDRLGYARAGHGHAS